jgi:cell division protein FtsW
MSRRAAAPAKRATKSSSAGVMPRLETSTWLLILVVALCVIGVVMVGSASSVVSISLYGSPWSIFFKELIWMVLGVIVLVATIRIDYHRWRRWAPLLVIITLGLLLVVLAPGLGVASGGSSRWIGFGQLRLQPSELMKLAIALFGADLVAKRQDAGGSTRMVLGPLVIVACMAAGLVVMQPDLGTAIVLMVITLSLLFASGIAGVVLAKGIAAFTVVVLLLAVAMPYRRERLLSFVNPGAKSNGSGYQVVQSLIGLGSGHLFGLGLGNSREKWGLLPNPHTDFIFSILGEELGLLGALCVLGLIGVFAFKCLKAAQDAHDRFGSLLVVGLTAWIVSESFINVGAVLGVLPVTGIPLPFISFGGSSLLITMAAAGMVINVARQGGDRRTRLRLHPSTRSGGTPKSGSSGSGRPARVR